MAAIGTVIPSPKFFAVDGNGTPYAGGKLFAFVAGTTTPLATYPTAALTPGTENAHPTILDSAGRATIFLQPASYRFVLQDSGSVQIWDVDNIGANLPFFSNLDVAGIAGEALSAGKVVFLSDGSGGLVAGRWYLTDADNAYSSVLAPIIGVVMSVSVATGDPISVRLSGRTTDFAGLVAGTTYYISAVAGALTAVPPTSGTRIVGRADSSGAFVMDPNPLPLEQVLNRTVTTITQAVIGPTTHYTVSIEGGTLKLSGRLRFHAICDLLNNTGVNQNVTVEVLYGATTIFTTGAAVIATGATARGATISVDLCANNATNAQVSSGEFDYSEAGTAGGVGLGGGAQLRGVNSAITEDSTAAKTFLVRVTLGITDANLVFRTFTCTLETL